MHVSQNPANLIPLPLSLTLTDAYFEKFKKNEFEIMPALAANLPSGPFTQEQLQEIAEEFKKKGFVLTRALATDLQYAAENFLKQRSKDQKTLRLAEERKNYEALREGTSDRRQ
jgi:hypothetical protein